METIKITNFKNEVAVVVNYKVIETFNLLDEFKNFSNRRWDKTVKRWYFPKEDLIGLLHLFNKLKIKVEVEDKENEVVKDTIEIVHNSDNKLEVYVNFYMQKKYKLMILKKFRKAGLA